MVRTSRKLVDTHAHICDPTFDADRTEVLRRAAAAGVGAVIAVGENISDAHKNIELAAEHPMLRPAAGLYPTILDLDQAEQMNSFIRRERSRLVAIGEVGLDFWVVKENADKEIQRDIFKGFIVTIIVATDAVDRILERMYVAGQLDTPGMGFLYVTPLEKAATYIPREIAEKLLG